MKRCLFLALVILYSVSFSMQISLVAGGLFSRYNPNESIPEISFRYVPNFVGGIGLEQPINDNWAVSAAILLGTRGCSARIVESDQTILQGTYRNLMLQFPITIKAKLKVLTPFYLLLGPRADFFLSHTLAFDSSEQYSLMDKTRSVHFGYDLGCGLQLAIGSRPFNIEFRYSQGLTSIYQELKSALGIRVDSFQVTISMLLAK